eukprot:GDKH01005595.1.p2 GENE.GDKH01005595.1~~GDKH01005595.1.p2  ORF type:complete len:62 (-),score=21.95 GDKH01005595.1:118-303(-)
MGDAYEEDATYWAEVQQQNQKVLDRANEDALKMAMEEVEIGDEEVFGGDDDVDLDDLEDVE